MEVGLVGGRRANNAARESQAGREANPSWRKAWESPTITEVLNSVVIQLSMVMPGSAFAKERQKDPVREQ